jgi:hypothetical protein
VREQLRTGLANPSTHAPRSDQLRTRLANPSTHASRSDQLRTGLANPSTHASSPHEQLRTRIARIEAQLRAHGAWRRGARESFDPRFVIVRRSAQGIVTYG